MSHRRPLDLPALRAVGLALACSVALPRATVLAQAPPDCPELTWADEFEGEHLDTAAWTYRIGDGTTYEGEAGWGNNELQYYKRENARLRDGELVITARREEAGGYDYTSARLVTKHKVGFTYGRVTGRLKVPRGRGLWPALWAMSTDNPYGTWPKSGEIDVMEYIGNFPTELLGSLHYGRDWPDNSYVSRPLISPAGPLHEDFHEYAMHWAPDSIYWTFDGYRYGTVTREQVEAGGLRWPFDHAYHVLVNLAVGGNLGGLVEPADLPAEYRVDYVRVYDEVGAYLDGPRRVRTGAAGARYRVGGVPEGAEVTWTASPNATVVSGAGTPAIAVDWAGEAGVGAVEAVVTSACGVDTMRVDVRVEDPAAGRPAYAVVDFDRATGAELLGASGALDSAAAPDNYHTLARGQIGDYTRDTATREDRIVFDVSALDSLDAGALARGDVAFSLDLRTAAPAGTEVAIALEGRAPAGGAAAAVHSRYRAEVPPGALTSLRRARFERVGDAGAGIPDGVVERLALMVAPDSDTGHGYALDNLVVRPAGS